MMLTIKLKAGRTITSLARSSCVLLLIIAGFTETQNIHFQSNDL